MKIAILFHPKMKIYKKKNRVKDINYRYLQETDADDEVKKDDYKGTNEQATCKCYKTIFDIRLWSDVQREKSRYW